MGTNDVRIKRIECTGCGAPIIPNYERGYVECERCGSVHEFLVKDTLHDQDERVAVSGFHSHYSGQTQVACTHYSLRHGVSR